MTINFSALDNQPRLLIEAALEPVQGTRFQPTGFPEIGAAEYPSPDGNSRVVLVESAQSMANRLEEVCWDKAADDWVEPLRGLPFVKVLDDKKNVLTNSLLEAHRLNSPYIVKADGFDAIKKEIGFSESKAFDVRTQLGPVLLKYDPNSLIHGIFLEKIAGVIRMPRMLSAFIEAADVKVAQSGGVKFDRVRAGTKDDAGKAVEGKTAKEGYGNLPFSRDEYVSGNIVAYFNLDLAQLRECGFTAAVNRLLIAISLYKIRRLLDERLKLRTACDFSLKDGGLTVSRPNGFVLPSQRELGDELKATLIPAVANEKDAKGHHIQHFAEPTVTPVTYKGK